MKLDPVQSWVDALNFTEASSSLLSARALQRRVDTKFVFPVGKLRNLLGELLQDFTLLRAGGEAVARYRNLYFDGADYDFLHAHHRGCRPRYKVRVRHYIDRELSYLEVKRKTNADLTVKERIPITYGREALVEEDKLFISRHCSLPGSELKPSFRADFGRLTLLGKEAVERATFDVGLSLSGDGHEAFPGLIVAEVKQDRFQPRSPMMLALRRLGIRPQSMSKYCTAAQLQMPDLLLNRFLPTLRVLRRTCHE